MGYGEFCFNDGVRVVIYDVVIVCEVWYLCEGCEVYICVLINWWRVGFRVEGWFEVWYVWGEIVVVRGW